MENEEQGQQDTCKNAVSKWRKANNLSSEKIINAGFVWSRKTSEHVRTVLQCRFLDQFRNFVFKT